MIFSALSYSNRYMNHINHYFLYLVRRMMWLYLLNSCLLFTVTTFMCLGTLFIFLWNRIYCGSSYIPVRCAWPGLPDLYSLYNKYISRACSPQPQMPLPVSTQLPVSQFPRILLYLLFSVFGLRLLLMLLHTSSRPAQPSLAGSLSPDLPSCHCYTNLVLAGCQLPMVPTGQQRDYLCYWAPGHPSYTCWPAVCPHGSRGPGSCHPAGLGTFLI